MYRLALPAFFVLLFLGTGCDTVDSDGPDLQEREAEIAASIMSLALSDQSDGMQADLHDAMALLAPDRMNYTTHDDTTLAAAWRAINELSIEFDEETGDHFVTYVRAIEQPGFFKSLDVESAHLFTDVGGLPIAFPGRDAADDEPGPESPEVASISFLSDREGIALLREEDVERESDFARTTDWTLDGFLEEEEDSIQLNGLQVSEGIHVFADEEDIQEYTYDLRLSSTNTRIEKDEELWLSERLAGTLSYQLTFEDASDPSTPEFSAQGQVEFDSDGTAIVRIEGYDEDFTIDLLTGEIARHR